MVKIAVPVESPDGMSSEVSDHFGMAEDFAVFDYADGVLSELEFLHNKQRSAETKNNGEFLADTDVKMVLAGSIGPHMLSVLLNRGVRIFKGATGTLEDVLEDYKAGMLTEVYSAGGML